MIDVKKTDGTGDWVVFDGAKTRKE